MSKVCCICKENKSFLEFSKSKAKKFGINDTCRVCAKAYKMQYRSNKEKVALEQQQQKEYRNRPDKKAAIAAYQELYYADVGVQQNTKKYFRDYNKKRRQNDPLYKLSRNMRTRIWRALKDANHDKNFKSLEALGCSVEFLKSHLESQFVEGMTWANYGDWHVDHIMPLASAKTLNEIEHLCHYSNLQPLWAIDNLRKSDKVG